jgi:3-phosphoshikimate 1-carboxyvinyltransferase
VIQQLGVVGLGLLGGSVAKAARAQGLAREIVGVGRDPSRLAPAVADGTLDRVSTDLAGGLAASDFVLLAVPVRTIESLLPPVWRAVPDGAIVTDVGSTKGAIVRAAERLATGRPLAFVGGHPLAGSEQSGYGVARADLFRGAVVILTPTDATAPGPLKTVTAFWEALGARVSVLDPETHDRAVAAISHLPHLVACALVDGVARFEPAALDLAARGFKDTTRIAAADARMWEEIFLANREALGLGLRAFRAALETLERLIDAGDGDALRAALDAIKTRREALR